MAESDRLKATRFFLELYLGALLAECFGRYDLDKRIQLRRGWVAVLVSIADSDDDDEEEDEDYDFA